MRKRELSCFLLIVFLSVLSSIDDDGHWNAVETLLILLGPWAAAVIAHIASQSIDPPLLWIAIIHSMFLVISFLRKKVLIFYFMLFIWFFFGFLILAGIKI